MSASRLRNIAIIAHVDHGKTTLVDRLLQQSGTLGARFGAVERVMDADDLERERGITILAKNTAIQWNGYRINIVDTPGHADFGGEVERVLSMVDAALLLVDAVDGPMPQTRFVTQKAFDHGLKLIVVINKIDRPEARPDWALDQTFDLFDRLGASDEQLDFPVVYTSAVAGFASMEADAALDMTAAEADMTALFTTIVAAVAAPDVDPSGAFQMQISALDYSKYVGVIGIGRIARGAISQKSAVAVVTRDGAARPARVLQIFGFHGLSKVEVEGAAAGDIVAITGVDNLAISDTLCAPSQPQGLPLLCVDEPTVRMNFQVNTSPFAGRDGKFVTSRQIGERLEKELLRNVALRVESTAEADVFAVSGRGELHLGILLETMRREGYEVAVSRPQAIQRTIDGVVCEPWEEVSADVELAHQGAVMQALGSRGGEALSLMPDGRGRARLSYRIPARGLIGFQSQFMTMTAGCGILHHVFEKYAALASARSGGRRHGALISTATGKALAFALFSLQQRGRLFLSPGAEVYEGQVIGLHARANDLTVNPIKGKQLTNIRAAGKDESIILEPPLRLTLETALETIDDDELAEITPRHIRIRKQHLTEQQRKQAMRLKKSA